MNHRKVDRMGTILLQDSRKILNTSSGWGARSQCTNSALLCQCYYSAALVTYHFHSPTAPLLGGSATLNTCLLLVGSTVGARWEDELVFAPNLTASSGAAIHRTIAWTGTRRAGRIHPGFIRGEGFSRRTAWERTASHHLGHSPTCFPRLGLAAGGETGGDSHF